MKRVLIVLVCAIIIATGCVPNQEKVIDDENKGRVVFISPKGERYHFSSDCAGSRAKIVYYGDIKKYYSPCRKCVQ